MKNRRAFLQTSAALLALGALPLAARAADGGSKVKIGMIGSGRIGSTLGRLWAEGGHPVMFSSLDLEHDKKLAAEVGNGARAGSSREAAAFGDVLLVAVPYSAMRAVGKDLGELLKGKIVIDASNPIESRDGEAAKAALEKGAGLASAELLPGAHIVRAFNAIGYARLPEMKNRDPKVGMPIAGDDKKAISVASGLIREIGLEPVLIGNLAMGKHLVPRMPLGGEHTPEEIRKIAATLS
jgi:predicted dinucleotide-binding enzyme